MSTQPIDQPRDNGGRFGPKRAYELDLTLAPPRDPDDVELVWPELDTPPREAQDMLYAVCWRGAATERQKLHAARGAISMFGFEDADDTLPPGSESWPLMLEASADDEAVLDAIHEVGPLDFPESERWGHHLAGALYDRAEALLGDRDEAAALAGDGSELPRPEGWDAETGPTQRPVADEDC